MVKTSSHSDVKLSASTRRRRVLAELIGSRLLCQVTRPQGSERMTKLALRLAIVIATVGLVASGTGYSMRPAQSADPTACPGEPAPAFTAKDNRGEDRHPCLLPPANPTASHFHRRSR